MRINPKIKARVDDFASRLNVSLADNLVSVTLYGSLAGGEYSKKYSDANILVVLRKVDIASLRRIARIKNNFKFKIIEPLVLDKPYLENSLDTFPIEFLDMQERYIVLRGEDCLKGLKIDLRNLRHQCEWELKSKIILMQQFYIKSQGKGKLLRQFLLKTLPSFLVIFKNIKRLKAAEFDFDKGLMHNLSQARLGNLRIADARQIFERFLLELLRLSDFVDKDV